MTDIFSQEEVSTSNAASQSESRKRKRCPLDCGGFMVYNGSFLECLRCNFTENLRFEESSGMFTDLAVRSEQEMLINEKVGVLQSPVDRRNSEIRAVLLSQLKHFGRLLSFEDYTTVKQRSLHLLKILESKKVKLPTWTFLFVLHFSTFSIKPVFFLGDFLDMIYGNIVGYDNEFRKVHKTFKNNVRKGVLSNVENVSLRIDNPDNDVRKIWCCSLSYFSGNYNEVLEGFSTKQYLVEYIKRIFVRNTPLMIAVREVTLEIITTLLELNGYRNPFLDEFFEGNQLRVEPFECQLVTYTLAALVLLFNREKESDLFFNLIEEMRDFDSMEGEIFQINPIQYIKIKETKSIVNIDLCILSKKFKYGKDFEEDEEDDDDDDDDEKEEKKVSSIPETSSSLRVYENKDQEEKYGNRHKFIDELAEILVPEEEEYFISNGYYARLRRYNSSVFEEKSFYDELKGVLKEKNGVKDLPKRVFLKEGNWKYLSVKTQKISGLQRTSETKMLQRLTKSSKQLAENVSLLVNMYK